LDTFGDDLLAILDQAASDPAAVQAAPVTLPVKRLDETYAARSMELTDDL
jgi:glycine dehydrogenase subunit 2